MVAYLSQHIESLIFTSERPITFNEIKSCLETVFESKLAEEELQQAIEEIKTRYQKDDFV